MSERTEISFDAALMMALRADAQKELDELPTSAQLKERYQDTSRWDARLKAALHKRHPVLKRVLVAALTLVILTLGALAVSADFRKAVYTMIQKFLPIEMQLTYQVDGEPLEQLPNGYSDHYVPDGFERDREQEFERAENFLHVYSSKESEKGYTVRCSIIQPGQHSSFDNEHKRILAFGETHCQFVAHLVGFFGGDLTGFERLPDLIGNHIAFLPAPSDKFILPFGQHKFFIHGQGTAFVTADQFALLCLVRVLGVIRAAFQAGRNGFPLVFVQRNQACCSHPESPP